MDSDPTTALPLFAKLFEEREDLRPTIRFDPWPDQEWTLDLSRPRPAHRLAAAPLPKSLT